MLSLPKKGPRSENQFVFADALLANDTCQFLCTAWNAMEVVVRVRPLSGKELVRDQK